MRLMWRLTIIFTLFICGCTTNNNNPITQVPTAVVPTPSEGKAVLTGKVLNIDGEPIRNTPIRLAQIFREGEQGAFMLDLAHSPSSISDSNGIFLLGDIPPAEYLLVIGKPEDNSYIIYQDKSGKPFTYQILKDTSQDLGEIKVDYSP